MSNFENIGGIIKAALVYEGKSQDEVNKEVLDKLIRKYNKIHFEISKKIIQPRYEAVKILFGT